MKRLLAMAVIGTISVTSLIACSSMNAENSNETVAEGNTDAAESTTTSDAQTTESTAAGEGKGHPRNNRNAGLKVNYDDLEHFTVESANLNDGVWDTKITDTAYGENISPELSWKPVEGATCYRVYMIDMGWLHMDAYTTECGLGEGEIDGSDENKYVGPYPPDGTHTYEVYVVALKDMPGEVKANFNAGGNDIGEILYQLNIDETGAEGNIISCGYISGTYTNGDK